MAAELQLDFSAVYKMCKSQQLPSVRFGESVRIPRLAYERYLQRLEKGRPKPLEHDSPGSQDQLEDFRDATGHDPETWIDGWRSGSIPDTPENTRLAIHALGRKPGGLRSGGALLTPKATWAALGSRAPRTVIE